MFVGIPQKSLFTTQSKALFIAVFLFFFVVDSFGACFSTGYGPDNGNTSGNSHLSSCEEKLAYRNIFCSSFIHCSSGNTCQFGNGYYNDRQWNCAANGWSGTQGRNCVWCEKKPDLDSLRCINAGKIWQDGQCLDPIDPTVCDSYKAECEKAGGKFNGSASRDGCRASCNTCNSTAFNKMRNRWINSCCAGEDGVLYAPPEAIDTNNCRTPDIAQGIGMNYSDVTCNSGTCYCQDLDDPEVFPNAQNDFNRYCHGGERYDENDPGNESSPDSADVPRDTIADGEGDWEYNYYPILDTIRDSLIYAFLPNVRDIASCLTTGTCVGGGDTVIVNADGGFDTSLVQQGNNKIDSVATRVSVLNDSTREYLRRQDSLLKTLSKAEIDSIIKYQNIATATIDDGVTFNTSRSIDSTTRHIDRGTDTLKSAVNSVADSLGKIGERLDSMYNGTGTDVSPGSDTTFNGLMDGLNSDTAGHGFLAMTVDGASKGYVDSVLNGWFPGGSGYDSASRADDSISYAEQYRLPDGDSLHDALKQSIQEDYDKLEDTLKTYFDTMREELQLINFDSAIIAPLGMKVPNTNTCPEDCFKIDMRGAGTIYSGVSGMSWPLCRKYSAMAGLDVMQFIRLILRIVTAIGCIYIGMWFIAGKR